MEWPAEKGSRRSGSQVPVNMFVSLAACTSLPCMFPWTLHLNLWYFDCLSAARGCGFGCVTAQVGMARHESSEWKGGILEWNPYPGFAYLETSRHHMYNINRTFDPTRKPFSDLQYIPSCIPTCISDNGRQILGKKKREKANVCKYQKESACFQEEGPEERTAGRHRGSAGDVADSDLALARMLCDRRGRGGIASTTV